ncbi:hypothetical protein [Palleronia aestuarii]|uniref:hypothetical protein n=1 Tax=Palleronia aestuarii TaxID=568105 RepID=UPI0011B633C7|nr:hypothetical protein [Palleronia aestuarii]
MLTKIGLAGNGSNVLAGSHVITRICRDLAFPYVRAKSNGDIRDIASTLPNDNVFSISIQTPDRQIVLRIRS